MSWLYLPEVVEGCSDHSCSDGAPSVTSSENRTVNRLSWQESETASCTTRPSGTTLEHSTGDPGVDAWISSLPVSPASLSQSPANNSAKTTSETAGQTPRGYLARYDPSTSCWRTSQRSLFQDTLEEFSGIFPRQGTMRDGTCFQRLELEHLTYERGSGYAPDFPTPAARDYRYPNKTPYSERGGGPKGEQLPNAIGGPLNPTWGEWLMAWPREWGALEPLATGRFQEWLSAHGVS